VKAATQLDATKTPVRPLFGPSDHTLVRVSLSTHREVRLLPLSDYFFASTAQVADIVAMELGQAAMSHPLAFRIRDETVDLVALMALPGTGNLFISLAGAWLSDFVPGSIATYPFRYAASTSHGKAALFVDQSSNLLSQTEGSALFAPDGKPSAKIQEIVRILRAYEKNRRVTQAACEQLLRFRLLAPWGADCEEEPFSGLMRVDEAAFNRLPEGMFSLLRKAGSLPIIYAHMLSLALLPRLAILARYHAAADERREKLLRSCFRVEESIEDTFKF